MCEIVTLLSIKSENLSMCFQFVLVSVGDVIVASSPAPLCDGDSHIIQVTISGNQTELLVNGKPGHSEDAEVSIDLLTQSSTFIGGLPGEDSQIYTRIVQHIIYTDFILRG